ncbi:carboxymuconolactone decarboxylase family protein [Desulfocurvus sp. DL9XJH121]
MSKNGEFIEDQPALRARTRVLARKYADELQAEVGQRLDALTTEIYASKALDSKTKRLMALAIAVTHGTRGCTLAQTDHCLNNGATVQEIMEACSVAVSMGGTMSQANTTRVVDYLEQLELI